jgi:hypothetical protein
MFQIFRVFPRLGQAGDALVFDIAEDVIARKFARPEAIQKILTVCTLFYSVFKLCARQTESNSK